MPSLLISLLLTLVVTSAGWGENVPAALEKSRSTGKPVLVYVLDVY